MARKHVVKHLAKLKGHHERYRKKLWKLLVKVAKNKNSYKPEASAAPKRRRRKRGGVLKSQTYREDKFGKMSATGKGKRPGQRASAGVEYKKGQLPSMSKPGKGMVAGQGLVTGQGLRKKRKKKKGPKKPKWITRKTIPKTFPKPPKNWHKHAAGLGSMLSSLGTSLSNTYNKHKDTINSIGSSIGKTVLDVGTQYVKGKIQQGQQAAQAQLQAFQQSAADAHAQAQQQVQQYTQQAQGMYNQGVQQANQFGQAAYSQAHGYGQQAMNQAQQYGQQAYNQGVQQANTFGQAAYSQARGYAGYN